MHENLKSFGYMNKLDLGLSSTLLFLMRKGCVYNKDFMLQ